MIRRGLACALALLPSLAFSQTVCSWTTDDDFILNTTTDASGATVIADPGSGVEYAAGMSTDGVTGHWVVRKRNNGVWSTVDNFIYSIGLNNAPRSMSRDSSGRLFVVGGANNTGNGGHWLVRRSTNSGNSWSTVDDFADPTVAASSAMAVTPDGSNVLVGGWHNESPQNWYHWVVRKSGTSGTSWTTQSDIGAIMYSAGVTSLDTDPSGNIYAIGWDYDGTGYHWQVRKRAASSTTWNIVDDQAPSTYAFFPVAVVAPANNVIYVAGYQQSAVSGTAVWTVRKTTNGGTSWSTVDTYTNNIGACAARGIAWNPQDSSIYVSGRCNAGTSYHWIVRRTANGGTTWTVDDDFQRNSGSNSFPGGISATGGGHVYATGVGNDGTHNHWITRRRECTAVAPLAPAGADQPLGRTLTSTPIDATVTGTGKQGLKQQSLVP